MASTYGFWELVHPYGPDARSHYDAIQELPLLPIVTQSIEQRDAQSKAVYDVSGKRWEEIDEATRGENQYRQHVPSTRT